MIKLLHRFLGYLQVVCLLSLQHGLLIFECEVASTKIEKCQRNQLNTLCPLGFKNGIKYILEIVEACQSWHHVKPILHVVPYRHERHVYHFCKRRPCLIEHHCIKLSVSNQLEEP